MKITELHLGDEVRDRITGFRGVVTGIVQYISGCDQALLAPPVKEDGTLPGGNWFDLDRLELVEAGVHQRAAATVGFDAPAPIR